MCPLCDELGSKRIGYCKSRDPSMQAASLLVLYHYPPVGLNFVTNSELCYLLFHRNNTKCVTFVLGPQQVSDTRKSSRGMDSIMDSVWYRELRNSGLPTQATVLIATVIVLIAIRRRFFSPISSVPGPFWASITRLWHLRQVASGKQNLKLLEEHDKHGMTPSSPAEESSSHLSTSFTHQQLVGQGTSCAWRQMKSVSATQMPSRLCS